MLHVSFPCNSAPFPLEGKLDRGLPDLNRYHRISFGLRRKLLIRDPLEVGLIPVKARSMLVQLIRIQAARRMDLRIPIIPVPATWATGSISTGQFRFRTRSGFCAVTPVSTGLPPLSSSA